MSQDATALAENWRTSNREHLKALKTDKEFKAGIIRRLDTDRQAVKTAGEKVAKRPNFGLLEKSEQQRQKTEAILLCVEQRIQAGRYVSCEYPEFEGFVPHLAYGKGGMNPIKAGLMARQLASLRKEQTGGHLDSDDEDEIEIKQEKSEHLPYVEARKSGPPETYKDKKSSKHGDKTTTTNQKSHHKHVATPSLRRKRATNSKGYYSDDEDKVIKWRAVSRGQPLPPGAPAANFEQRKPKTNPWLGRVVFRGQVMVEDSKDEN